MNLPGTFTFILFLLSSWNISAQPADNITYLTLKEAFFNPSDEARPKVYWWVLNGNVDTLRARQELTAMKNNGISGFDFFEIGVPAHDTMIPSGPAFMSDQSIQTIKFVAELAKNLDLTMGLNLSSSWNAGGSWVKPEHAGKSLYKSEIKIIGNSKTQKIKLPFPEISFPQNMLIGGTQKPMIAFRKDGKPEYYEEIAILAIPETMPQERLDTSQIINITKLFNPESEILKWKAPPGNWRICRYVCSNSGQQVVLPSPNSAGLTIDHFDSTAVEKHLMYFINKLQLVLGDFKNSALKSFYLASYEARGFVWTSSLTNEFRNLNGYNIQKYLPIFFEPDLFPQKTNEQVQTDFKKTLSELMINNLYKKSKEICNQYGLKINCEAGGPGYPLYNGPAEPLKALGSLDIPRGEFWVNHSRYYTDNNGDTIDILRVVKEVAAASHIYQKGVVEQEAFTSFMHWQEGPGDIKQQSDRAFCEGMNKVVFHGFSHNISEAGSPGFVYGAGTHFNDKRVWWTKAKPFVDYLARISAVVQKTDFVADVIWYYGDKIPNSATSKNAHFKVGPGFDYEVINTDILLNNLEVRNGKLILSNGAEFQLLVLENEDLINPKVLVKVNELVEKGAVILGTKPIGISQIKNSPLNQEKAKTMINNLWKAFNSNEVQNRQFVLSGISPQEMLKELQVEPDIRYNGNESELLDFIHYKMNEIDVYFIRNTKDEWFSRNIAFRQKTKSPEIWNAVTGKINSVTVYNQKNNITEIPVTLPPVGSCFVVFQPGSIPPVFQNVKDNNETSPPFLFTPKGIVFLAEGNFMTEGSKQSISINNKIETRDITGSWNIEFTKGWGAPEKTTFPELISWTEDENKGIKYYSGSAKYEKTFLWEELQSTTENSKIFLDLGEISKVARVWLNNEELGIIWTKPYWVDVTEVLKNGENSLVIEVSNTWSNRLTGDAVMGANYTNTNITTTIIPAPTIKTGDQTRYSWKDVPLIKSGLLGPVKIKIFHPVIIN